MGAPMRSKARRWAGAGSLIFSKVMSPSRTVLRVRAARWSRRPRKLAVAAYLARFKGSSREHTESDLRCFLPWCAERGLDPLAARRPHLELYIRWMQEIRRFKPSTVSRRFSVAAGFYRTCVRDARHCVLTK
jgi:hypothetical protein